MVRTPISTHLDFNPYGDTIPNLFDDFDRCMNAYFDKLEDKISKNKAGEVMLDFARIIELSSVGTLPTKRMFLSRFRTVANILKSKGDPKSMFEKQIGRKLSRDELLNLEERIKYARIYLDQYAQTEVKSPEKPFIMNDSQKNFLKLLQDLLSKNRTILQEDLQNEIFSLMKQGAYKPREVFQALYRILTGKDYGPKAAELIMTLGVDKTLDLLRKNNGEPKE
jgi:lysyl-tRNA synthetase class 1